MKRLILFLSLALIVFAAQGQARSPKVNDVEFTGDDSVGISLPALRVNQSTGALRFWKGGSFHTVVLNDELNAGHTIKNSGTPLTDRDNLNFTNGLTASDNSPDTDVKLGGSITSSTSIATTAPNQLIWNGSWTTTATDDYVQLFGGTYTLRGTTSDRFRGFRFSPTIIAGANNQSLEAVTINPIFTAGSFTGLTQSILRLGDTNNNVSFFGGGSARQRILGTASDLTNISFQHGGNNTAIIGVSGSSYSVPNTIFLETGVTGGKIRFATNVSGVAGYIDDSQRWGLGYGTTTALTQRLNINGSVALTGNIIPSGDLSISQPVGNTITFGTTAASNNSNRTVYTFQDGTFSPASGTNGITYMKVTGTINQAGSSSGAVNGIIYVPAVVNVNGLHRAWLNTEGFIDWNSFLSPAQITSNQTDYNPTGWNGAQILRLNTDASRTINSLGSVSPGRIAIFANTGSNDLVLHNDDGSTGTASQRFLLPNGLDLTIPPGGSVVGFYDASDSRWRIADKGNTGIGGSTGSTDNALLRADGTGGSTLQNSSATINDSGVLTLPSIITGLNGSSALEPGSPTSILAQISNNVNNVGIPFTVAHYSTVSPSANNMGAGIRFVVNTDLSGNNEIGSTIESLVTDVTSTSEDFDLVFKTMDAGAAATEKMRLTSDATSGSRLRVMTAGSGDASVSFDVTGGSGPAFTMGVDNSSSDQLTISSGGALGSNNIFSASSTQQTLGSTNASVILNQSGYSILHADDAEVNVGVTANQVDITNASVTVESAFAMYFGDPATDGTWRMIRSGSNFLVQRRESGSYVTKQTFTP